MKTIDSINNLSLKNTAICIGNFDGFHLGHEKIVSILKEKAKSLNLQSVILTFNPHPYKFFKKDVSLISCNHQRIENFKKQNTDYLVTAEFNEYLSSLPAEDFFKKILIEKLDAKFIVVGVDYRFGVKRSGDINLLSNLCKKYNVEYIFTDKVKDKNNNEISSSSIRNFIKNSQLKEAKEYLGRYYSIYGKVVSGKGKGREFGYPTVNLNVENDTLLNTGSYATDTVIDGIKYKSMTYIGYCATISNENNIKVETNIFDFNENIYGKNIEIYFKEFIRKDEKFNSIEKLVEAINNDKIKAMKCE